MSSDDRSSLRKSYLTGAEIANKPILYSDDARYTISFDRMSEIAEKMVARAKMLNLKCDTNRICDKARDEIEKAAELTWFEYAILTKAGNLDDQDYDKNDDLSILREYAFRFVQKPAKKK